MNLNLCLIRLPIVLSQSFSRSGSQGVTGNAYAMLDMIKGGLDVRLCVRVCVCVCVCVCLRIARETESLIA